MRDRTSNVLSLLEDRTNSYANKIALGMKSQYGWKEFTYNGLGLLSRRIAAHLKNDLQLQKGERLTILSESKPEYGTCVFASIIAGLVTVPLDIKLTKFELKSILSDCNPSVMLVSQKYVNTALELQKELPSLKHIIVMDEPSYNQALPSIYTIPNNYNCKFVHRSRHSTLFIIYTSGTTGAPKGVETSFGNILSQLDDLKAAFSDVFPREARILSILPMNHLFEMTVGFSTFLNFGFSVYYTHSLKPKDIMKMMEEKQIQYMVAVPAFIKLLKTAIENEVNHLSPLCKMLFEFKLKLAKFIPFTCVKRFMFRDIHKYAGGKFRGFISGGAPLDIDSARFFERVGISIYQVYGLTETSPVATANTIKFRDMESVGRPLKSFEAKVDEQTGELLLRGPAVMKGYHNQPELTASVIDKDGWFHTGDIAKINKKGFVYITGRIKNMIVLSGGKKVFPEEVESVLEQSEYFAEVCVLGVARTFGAKDGTEDIAAVIVPKEDLINQYDDETLNSIIKGEVKKLCMQLTAYKRPINIVVSKTPLPRTATKKVKRKEVKELVKA